jgi:hypothetical protein
LGRDPTSPLNPPYHDESTIRADLAVASFVNVEVERISLPVKAASAREAAIITVHGSLIGNALEAAAPGRLGEATEAVDQALRSKFGAGEILGSTNAMLVAAEKPMA